MTRRTRTSTAAVAALLWGLLVPVATAETPPRPPAGGLTEVARLPVVPGDVYPNDVDQSGWLVLSGRTRRAYQIFETAGTTEVQSFDLDTLAPRRRAVFVGLPIAAGTMANFGGGVTLGSAAEVVHAVDEVAGRVYLALSDTFAQVVGYGALSQSSDSNRAVARYVAIDERAFDEGKPDFAASFPDPLAGATWLRSLTVDRSRSTGGFGRLVGVVTHTNVYDSPGSSHQLRQWDVSSLAFGEAASGGVTQPAPPPETNPLLGVNLSVCAGSSMAHGTPAEGTYQWGVLMAPEGAWLGCQSSTGSARAVFVPLDARGRPTIEAQQAFPLSKPVSDVLVDRGGRRLLFVTAGFGRTAWVFDVRTRRFAGALPLTVGSGGLSLGVDGETGRLYVLVGDGVATEHGRDLPARGGLLVADTRLDPVPSADNVDPSLAYPAVFRIAVDTHPVTGVRRVFVRRGKYSTSKRLVYPGTQPTEPSPVEPYYRVLRDDVPVREAVVEGPEADRRFTVNTAEAEGVTQASYRASGSGYGTRSLLIGGLAAATGRGPTGTLIPGCDKDDREVLAAQVEQAVLSDVSAAAGAASLAGDARTEEQAGEVVSRCPPEPSEGSPKPFRDGVAQAKGDGDDALSPLALGFDRDGDEASDYRTSCTDDADPPAKGPEDAPGRSAFTADVACGASEEKVSATATGAFGLTDTGVPVQVGWSHSEATVTRKAGKGAQVRVDSIARDVVIDGVGRIGVVRATATSKAAGRDGTARAGFERRICGVDLLQPRVFTPDCLSPEQERTLVESFNDVFTGQVQMRLRDPEDTLLGGSVSGYRAGVQRQAQDLFQDARITKDTSLAVPGLELVFYRGDSGLEGPGRQIVQLAGVQAATSYGIYCLLGEGPKGCATTPATFDEPGADTGGSDGGSSLPPEPRFTVDDDGDLVALPFDGEGGGGLLGGGGREGILTRLLRLPVRAAADLARLAFNNPRELGLVAAVWALLYAPCYLAERRRTVARLASLQLQPSTRGAS